MKYDTGLDVTPKVDLAGDGALSQGYTKLNKPRPLDTFESFIGEQGADPVTNQFYTEDSDGFLPRHHGLSR
jgi:hypothetical protein